MAELKYTYALDKNENCIGIENAQKGIEYRCPHCKGEMVVKEGSIKEKIDALILNIVYGIMMTILLIIVRKNRADLLT